MVSLSVIEYQTSVLQAAIAGALAGAITRTISQPLDVLKVRFQLQIEPIKNGSKYSSMLQAVASIIKDEGIGAMWSGHIPAQVLSITYGLLQFSAYEKLTQLCQNSDAEFYLFHKHWINFCNGAVAATIATVASYPFDTVRTRLIAEQKTKKAYKGFCNAIVVMTKTEGPRALFKGLNPTLGQIAPHAGIQFTVYKLFSEDIFTRFKFFQRQDMMQKTVESSLPANLLSGSISGLIAKTAIYPFDLVKKRLQIQGFQQHRVYFGRQMYCNGVLQCLRLTINEEGFLALYKGYGPSTLKAVIVTALHFGAYDELKHLFSRISGK